MKITILILSLLFLSGCISTGRLYEHGEYVETVCSGIFNKKCKEVTRNGLHLTKKISVTGIGGKFDFGKGTGEGTKVMPDLSGLQLRDN